MRKQGKVSVSFNVGADGSLSWVLRLQNPQAMKV